MYLDEQDLRSGLEFICGTWQVDFVVNAFSNDLAHIPAAEFKSDDGTDFSAITFTFEEDHTVKMTNGTGSEETCTWEQTGWSEYHYSPASFLNIPDGPFKANAEKLTCVDGALCFQVGFLSIGMKKIAEGHVTKEPDIGDIEPSEDDLKMTDIVGTYAIYKTFFAIGEEFGMFTEAEVKAELDRKVAAGEMDGEMAAEYLGAFGGRVEFTADHRLVSYAKIPDGVTEEMIKEAIEAGEISEVKDGFYKEKDTEWKAVNGKYYYDTGREQMIMGKTTSWEELTLNGDECSYGSGMILLKKI